MKPKPLNEITRNVEEEEIVKKNNDRPGKLTDVEGWITYLKLCLLNSNCYN